jgi:hypothetical protein
MVGEAMQDASRKFDFRQKSAQEQRNLLQQ